MLAFCLTRLSVHWDAGHHQANSLIGADHSADKCIRASEALQEARCSVSILVLTDAEEPRLGKFLLSGGAWL